MFVFKPGRIWIIMFLEVSDTLKFLIWHLSFIFSLTFIGKLNRGLSVLHSTKILKKGVPLTADEEFKACALGWCIEWVSPFQYTLTDSVEKWWFCRFSFKVTFWSWMISWTSQSLEGVNPAGTKCLRFGVFTEVCWKERKKERKTEHFPYFFIFFVSDRPNCDQWCHCFKFSYFPHLEVAFQIWAILCGASRSFQRSKVLDFLFLSPNLNFIWGCFLGQVTYQTASGQMLDLITTPEGEVDLSKYILSTYLRIVKYKTAYYSFYLPVRLALSHFLSLWPVFFIF